MSRKFQKDKKLRLNETMLRSNDDVLCWEIE